MPKRAAPGVMLLAGEINAASCDAAALPDVPGGRGSSPTCRVKIWR